MGTGFKPWTSAGNGLRLLRIEQKLKREVSVDEGTQSPLNSRAKVQLVPDPAQVEPDQAFNGVNDHAHDEEDPHGRRILDGHVVQEQSDRTKTHVGQKVRKECHDLKKYFNFLSVDSANDKSSTYNRNLQL